MSPRSSPLIALALLALVLPVGLSCSHRAASSEASTSPSPQPSPPRERPAAESPVALPSLPEPARRELETVMSDEFCYCGCPHTLGACLREHPTCEHAKRMLKLASADARAGVAAVETIVSLQRYYAGFREPRAELPVDARQCRGPADAPVTVVEFSDFECPYCGAARPVLESWAKANESRVRFCVLPFPLQSHPNAIPAGQAALFAREHGKYWEMHDALFEHQLELSPATIVRLGKELGLDGAALETVLRGETYKAELLGFKELGRKAGVTATPMLYVNGRKLTLPLDAASLSHTLEDELEWKAHNGAWQAD